MKRGTNPCQKFVSEYARLFQSGKNLPAGNPQTNPPRRKLPADAPKALIFSPHPDDECIVGGLALRLLREAKWNVINVAVTLGGNVERRTGRLAELRGACDFLGFGLAVAGWEDVNPDAHRENRPAWRAAVEIVAEILTEQQPRAIFVPHESDRHPTHVGTHLLVLNALAALPVDFACHIIETEFWGQMNDPNLLVESGVEDVGDLVAALACHAGEVRRNPYHARLPARMIDNVRRGAEQVGELGGSAPDFTFATIYRLRQWTRGRLANVLKQGTFLPCAKNPAGLFQ
ncbi:MAG: PIG-L family deacetylase [Verrucomicrobiota bacterium]